ncbi:hypothetical protein V5O48_004654 [Marasmius crinis-equi]|uniref:ASST-domain-containing protein n=1 Tax=Marasmius crinis-equi TaxID=585013 RepID=A0ABR3FQE6_9AGAR
MGLLHYLILLLCVSYAYASKAFIEDSSYEDGSEGPGPSQSFLATTLTPVQWNFVLPTNDSTSNNVSSGLIFNAPRGKDVKQPGGVIWNQDGTMVWSAADFGETLLFYPVKYKNKDHILIWTGQFSAAGFGFGFNLLVNQSYAVVANFTTKLDNGALADFHDAVITTNNTAIMTAYTTQPQDLTQFQGPNPGFIAGGAFQELNIDSGNVVFTWNSLDHIDPSECYVTPGTSGGSTDSPWDYFVSAYCDQLTETRPTTSFNSQHINSVDKDSSGNYLISSRHCHALYYLDGTSGDILWRIGGKNSTFNMGDGTLFSWQHEARWHGNNQISLFDNAASDWESDGPTARGLLLNVDVNAKTVTLARQVYPFVQSVSTSQGSVQILDNGNMLVGFGSRPYFAEYDSNGNMLYSVHFGIGDVQSYRAVRATWVGRPNTKPTLGFSSDISSDFYASWNGATEVATWELFGSTADQPQKAISLNTSSRTDFETTIFYTGTTNYDFYQVAAKNDKGQHLAYSDFRSRSGNVVAAATNQTVDAPPLDSTDSDSSNNSTSSNGNGGAKGNGAGSTLDSHMVITIAVAVLLALLTNQ